MNKPKRKPPSKTKQNSNFDVSISDSNRTFPAEQQVINFPWKAANVRDDVTKVFNLRLPEPYFLKLKFIAEHTPNSMQAFCLGVLQDAIDKKIKELTK